MRPPGESLKHFMDRMARAEHEEAVGTAKRVAESIRHLKKHPPKMATERVRREWFDGVCRAVGKDPDKMRKQIKEQDAKRAAKLKQKLQEAQQMAKRRRQ